jgi:hypothetical protein
MALPEAPEPVHLGTCYTLGELERTIARAINRYGSDTKLYGSDERAGISVDAHLPKGEKARVVITRLEFAYSNDPPENIVKSS